MRSKLKFSEDNSIWLLNFAFNFFLNKNFQPIMHRNGVALYSSQAFHHSPTTSSLWGLLLSICFGTKVSFFSCKQYLATLSSLGCPPYLSSLSFSPKLYIPSAIKLKYTAWPKEVVARGRHPLRLIEYIIERVHQFFLPFQLLYSPE